MKATRVPFADWLALKKVVRKENFHDKQIVMDSGEIIVNGFSLGFNVVRLPFRNFLKNCL